MTEPDRPGDGTPHVLRDRATTTADALRRHVESGAWTDTETATMLLNITRATLLDLIVEGQLDGVVLDGEAWVNGAALQLRVIEHAEMGAARTRESRALARTALRGYLAARPVHGDWEGSRAAGRPLICARRGKASTWLRHGVTFHTVALNPRWVTAWAMTSGVAELAALPAGPHLRALLTDLAGVEPVGSVTPLSGKARAHTVSGWVRVDTEQWSVVLPPEVERAIAAPAPDPIDALPGGDR